MCFLLGQDEMELPIVNLLLTQLKGRVMGLS